MYNLFKSMFGKYKKDMILIITLSFILSFIGGIGIVMLIPLLSVIDIVEAQPGILSFASSLFIKMPHGIRVFSLLFLYVALVTLSSFLGRAMTIVNSKFVQKYTKDLRLSVYNSIMNAKWEVLTAQKQDELLNSFTIETSRVSMAVSLYPKLISMALSSIIQITIALMLNVPLTLIIIATGSVFFFAFRNLFAKAKQYGEHLRIANQEFLGEIRSQIDSIDEIKSYGVEKLHERRFKIAVNDYEIANVNQAKLSSLPKVIFSISSTVLIAIVFFVSNVILRIEFAELIIIVYIFTRIWPFFSRVHSDIQRINMAIPSYDSISELIESLDHDSIENKASDGVVEFCTDIRFNDVSFGYASSNQKVLNDINISIKANKITALSGQSGVGKTTLVNLLMGFLSPSKGQILVDDIALDNTNIRTWRKSIAYIPQEPIILNKTVRENIKRFNPKVTDDDIFSALKRVKAFEFVEKLPQGLDTLLGDRGIRLSGGEKQRIVLARALVGKPKILILDEATSALDNENEKSIQQTIQSLKKSVTVIIIAHREGTIQSADEIIRIENGKAFCVIKGSN